MSMTAGSEWQGRLGEKWADEWRRTDRSFGMLTERLLERTREFTFKRVVDIGCGAGELSLAIARGRPAVPVTGVDISPALIDAANRRGTQLPNVSFELADAASWTPDADAAPDFILSRHGVMFFADPVAAFAHIRNFADDGASLMFSCFRDRTENDWVQEMAALLPSGDAAPPDPYAPGPFAFGDPNHVKAILENAGWKRLAFEAYDFAQVAGGGADPVEDAVSYFLSIGPAAVAARQLTDSERADFGNRMRAMLRDRLSDGIVSLRAAAWIVTAYKD